VSLQGPDFFQREVMTMTSDPCSRYADAKASLWRIDRVIGLVGKRYAGGGGGVGAWKSANVKSLTVYSQESDGARNYHNIGCGDAAIEEAINVAALEMAPQIAARAREILAVAVRERAKEASAVLQAALADAGDA
jgi:hypothetical protein